MLTTLKHHQLWWKLQPSGQRLPCCLRLDQVAPRRILCDRVLRYLRPQQRRSVQGFFLHRWWQLQRLRIYPYRMAFRLLSILFVRKKHANCTFTFRTSPLSMAPAPSSSTGLSVKASVSAVPSLCRTTSTPGLDSASTWVNTTTRLWLQRAIRAVAALISMSRPSKASDTLMVL